MIEDFEKALKEYQEGKKKHWTAEQADALLLRAIDAGAPIQITETRLRTGGGRSGEIKGHTFVFRGAVISTTFSDGQIQGSISIIDPDLSLSAPQNWIEK